MADPNAAPNPSTTAAATSRPLLSPDEMSDAQLTEFFAKGPIEKTEAPAGDDPPPADQPADSAPADAVDPAASTDASSKAASETAAPEKKPKGKGLKARVEQLDQENEQLSSRLTQALRRRRELNEQLGTMETDQPAPKKDGKPDSSAAASAAPTEADFKRYLAMPGAPKAEQFDGDLDAYTAAMGAFIAKQIVNEQFDTMFDARQQKSAAEHAQQEELQQAITSAEARAATDEKRDPEWRTKVDPALAAIPPLRMLPPGVQPNVMNFIKDQVMFECEHPCSMHVFLSSDEGKAWAKQLVAMRPERILREIAIKDASFATSPDDDDQPTSLVSAAPPPGETLGRKASKPVDPLKAAIDANDPEAFINQRNKALVGAGQR